MAFNLATFKTRALTAVIFLIVMLVGLLWNQWSFLILFTVIHFGCWWEYIKLVGLIDKNYQNISLFHKYGIMLLGFGIMLCFTNSNYTLLGDIQLKYIGWILIIVLVPVIIYGDMILVKPINFKPLVHSLVGLIYVSLSWGLMMSLKSGSFLQQEKINEYLEKMYIDKVTIGELISFKAYYQGIGFLVCLSIIASIWINDTMAYIVGSFMGKTPLSKISPKKTWEGTIGGVILCVLIVGFSFSKSEVFKFNFGNQNLSGEYRWYIIAAISAISGTMGDLLESKLKRMAGVKDSGSLMPGHGGFLDRFDSLLLATPFVWLYVYFFIR